MGSKLTEVLDELVADRGSMTPAIRDRVNQVISPKVMRILKEQPALSVDQIIWLLGEEISCDPRTYINNGYRNG